MRAIVLYYSQTNHTKEIAEIISNELGIEIARIQTDFTYPDDYDEMILLLQNNPQISLEQIHIEPAINLDNYSDFILGSPIWNGMLPPPVSSLLSSIDLTGRRIYPFYTFGGHMGQVNYYLNEISKGASIRNSIKIKYTEDKYDNSTEHLKEWIEYVKRDAKFF